MKDTSKYFTKNLFVATYLLASGQVTFLGLQELDYKTKLFVFTPVETSQKLETEYFSGVALSAKSLFSEYNLLKDLLFQRETNGEYDNR